MSGTGVFEAVAIAVAIACAGCGVRPGTARLVTVFGPAVGSETISGRIDEGDRVMLMVGGTSVITIDLKSKQQQRTKLALPGRERCWGLARLADGSLWTLLGRSMAIRIGADGAVERELPLDVPHLGIFGVADRLILQPAAQPVDRPALTASRPDDPVRQPWSAITVRAFPALASGAAAALNLVSCGAAERDEVPCWFPYEPAVWVMTSSGETRRVPLAGLPEPAPESLINAAAPQRPVRDVFVQRDGVMWVLSTGEAPRGGADLPGGWLLARYGPHGEPIDRRRLPEPARLILRAAGGRALLLTGAGMIAEVQP